MRATSPSRFVSRGSSPRHFSRAAPTGSFPARSSSPSCTRSCASTPAPSSKSSASQLCRRVLTTHRQVTRVRVEIAEQPWRRMDVGGKPHGQTFVLGGSEQRTVAITSNGAQTAVVAGIDSLAVMRTSGFLPRRVGPRADDGLDDALQALLVGSLSAKWTYSNADVTFGPYRQGVRAAIAETFAVHAARSVQHTLYAIADVVLATYEEILDITLVDAGASLSSRRSLQRAGREPRRTVHRGRGATRDRGGHRGARLLASALSPDSRVASACRNLSGRLHNVGRRRHRGAARSRLNGTP